MYLYHFVKRLHDFHGVKPTTLRTTSFRGNFPWHAGEAGNFKALGPTGHVISKTQISWVFYRSIHKLRQNEP